MKATADPDVMIEDQRDGLVRYRSLVTGARWEVSGACDRRGLCLVGSVIDGTQVTDLDHLARMVLDAGVDRIDSELDVPVLPGFSGCCPLVGRWL